MAFEEKKYLDLAGLQSYDAKIKAKIDAADATLDAAIKAVDGKVTAEVANREAADLAINNKIGTVEDGKTVVDMINDAKNAASGANTALEARVKTNEDAIAAINDPATGILKVAKDYTDAEANRAKAAEKVNADDIDALETRATEVEGKVTTLIGTDANKSVRTIANEELAAQLLSGDAEADFKTLQELAAWLEDHPEDVAAINLAIENLEKLVGTLPTDTTATDIVGYIQQLVKAEEDRAVAAEEALDLRVDALEAAVGADGKSVADQINDKIATLDADESSAAPEAGKGVQVQVVEVDGVITSVAVTGNYDNAYDAKGAAATAEANAVATAAADATTKADAAQAAAEATAAADATAKANAAEVNAKAYADSVENSFKSIETSEIDALFATV